jgi:uncharacterized protein YggE
LLFHHFHRFIGLLTTQVGTEVNKMRMRYPCRGWLPLALALVSTGVNAQSATAPMTPQVSAQGTSEVRVAPDRAIAQFGVQFQAADARTAQGRVNEAMQRVIQALRGLNIPANRISTERIELFPVYEPVRPADPDRPPRLAGYRAANHVRVELDNLARLGPVIDAAVGAGANAIEGVQFTIADDAPYRVRALRQASDEARTKARAIAEALGVGLGTLLEASEGGVEVNPPRPLLFEKAAMADTPVQPGEISIRATVQVRYAIGAGQIKKEP